MSNNHNLTNSSIAKRALDDFYNVNFPEEFIGDVLVIHTLISPLYPPGCEGNLIAKKGFWLSRNFVYPSGIHNCIFQGEIKENLRALINLLEDLESWSRNC